MKDLLIHVNDRCCPGMMSMKRGRMVIPFYQWMSFKDESDWIKTERKDKNLKKGRKNRKQKEIKRSEPWWLNPPQQDKEKGVQNRTGS